MNTELLFFGYSQAGLSTKLRGAVWTFLGYTCTFTRQVQTPDCKVRVSVAESEENP